jgi:hypothetical protein
MRLSSLAFGFMNSPYCLFRVDAFRESAGTRTVMPQAPP